ncbi:MAG: DUF4199 domain-containing protein [Chitinophagales bacterium]|nr:DUF4199 domain-containing protein [Chitinophagales bacterium]
MDTLDQPTIPDPSTVSNRDLAVKYGAIWGGSSILMSLIAYLTNNDLTMPDTGAIKWVFMLVGLGITVWAVVAAIKTDRERLGGFISFGRCISLSAFMGLISGAISMVYMFLYAYVINPDFQSQMKDAMYAQWEAQGMSEEQMEMAAGMAGMFTGPTFMAISQLIGGVIMGVVFGLIVGAFMKRERSLV